MTEFVDLEVPFQKEGNKLFLTELQLQQERWIAEFVHKFKNCFRIDPAREVYWYEPK